MRYFDIRTCEIQTTQHQLFHRTVILTLTAYPNSITRIVLGHARDDNIIIICK